MRPPSKVNAITHRGWLGTFLPLGALTKEHVLKHCRLHLKGGEGHDPDELNSQDPFNTSKQLNSEGNGWRETGRGRIEGQKDMSPIAYLATVPKRCSLSHLCILRSTSLYLALAYKNSFQC